MWSISWHITSLVNSSFWGGHNTHAHTRAHTHTHTHTHIHTHTHTHTHMHTDICGQRQF